MLQTDESGIDVSDPMTRVLSNALPDASGTLYPVHHGETIVLAEWPADPEVHGSVQHVNGGPVRRPVPACPEKTRHCAPHASSAVPDDLPCLF